MRCPSRDDLTNKRVEFARTARPTRKRRNAFAAAYPHRWVAMTHKVGVALVMMLVAAGPAIANERNVLRELRDQLRYVRALDAGAEVDMWCPEKSRLLHLRGLKKTEVFDQLSEPDFEEEEEEAEVHSWSYFLTGAEKGVVDKDGNLQLSTGGGFPIVTFFFNAQEVVELVTCAYAR